MTGYCHECGARMRGNKCPRCGRSMRGIFLGVAAMATAMIVLALCGIPAQAQNPVLTQPLPGITTNASSTIAVTNTFQSVFAADTRRPPQAGRSSCTVQNNSAANPMYVYFGAIAGATLAKSVKLAAGQAVNCAVFGVVLKDQVSVTGTAGDAFYAAQQ